MTDEEYQVKQENMVKEADDLIDLIEDAVKDLGYWSVRHDDYFNYELGNFEEMINSCRKQLIGDAGIIDTQH